MGHATEREDKEKRREEELSEVLKVITVVVVMKKLCGGIRLMVSQYSVGGGGLPLTTGIYR